MRRVKLHGKALSIVTMLQERQQQQTLVMMVAPKLNEPDWMYVRAFARARACVCALTYLFEDAVIQFHAGCQTLHCIMGGRRVRLDHAVHFVSLPGSGQTPVCVGAWRWGQSLYSNGASGCITSIVVVLSLSKSCPILWSFLIASHIWMHFNTETRR